nr:MFS transporter [Candidatus Frackibacter sp. WG12]
MVFIIVSILQRSNQMQPINKLEQRKINKETQSKTLLSMSIFIFLMSIGEGLTAPAIPLYGDLLGSSYKQLGFLMTGYSIAFTFMTVTAGRISDKIGRKYLLLLSIILSVIASAGYYYSNLPSTLLIFRTLEGMSRGILWPIAETIVADNTNYDDRGKAIGRFTAAYGAGVTVGTLSGGYIMQFIDLTAVFPFYPILSIIALIIVMAGVTEMKTESNMHTIDTDSINSNAFIEEIKKIWPMCYVGFAYSGFLYSIWGLLSKVADIFGVSLWGIGIIFSLFWVMRLITVLTTDKIAMIIGRKKLLIIGLGCSTLATGIFLIANNFEFLIFAAIWGGIGTGIILPVNITLISDSASEAYRGFSLGFSEFCMGIGMIIQTALSGILGELGGANYTYLFTFIVTLIAIPIALIFIQETEKS